MAGIPKGWEIEAEPSPFDLNAAADFGSQWGRVTSTARTPEHNRKVGGVPNSYHLTTRGARAIDIARGPGVRHADIEAAYRGAGYDLIEALDEGDHSHFAFRSGPAAPQPEQQAAGIPDGWEIEPPEAAPARPQTPPVAASFAPGPTRAPAGPLPSAAPQLTQDDRTRGLSVSPAEPPQAPAPWAQGYESTVDPEKVAQLNAALNGGASVEQLLTLANQLGGYQLVGGADAVREAVKYRDSGRKGAGFYADRVAAPKKEEPIITSRDWSDLTIPQKAGDIMGNLARAIGHPYANRIERETTTAADWVPLIGGASSIERGKEDFDRGEYGSAALNASLGTLDFIPAVGPLARAIGKGGKHVVDATMLRSIASDADGAVDMGRAGTELREAADEALARGGTVTLHVEGKAIPITKPGLVDDAGQSWGAMPILSPKAGDNARLEIDVPQASDSALPAPSGNASERVVDRIDVGIPKGWEIEPPLGRTRPMDALATPEEMAAAARGVRPQDIRPIPANRLENLDEFERIGDPRPLLTPPNPADELAMRSLAGRNRRGPPDLVTWIRSQPWALKDEGGELAQYGITNKPRTGLDLAGGEGFLGRLVDNANGRSIDDAAQAAWDAGYFPHHTARPSIAEFLETLSDTHRGSNRAFRPDDLDEVQRYGAAAADRDIIQAAAQEGKPLADDIGQPVGLGDLSANEPPAYAYEDLPNLGGRVANIDVAKLETRGDIRRALQNVESRFGGFDAARRGKVSQAETRALASELRMTPHDLMRRRKGQALNAEEALAARQILAKSADELVALASRAVGGSDEELAAFHRALLRHAAIQEQVTGATAEAGRALAQFKMVARARDARLHVMKGIIDGAGGRGRIEDIAEAIIEAQRDPAKLNSFALQATKPKMKDKLVEYWINSLLSGPQTHAVNFVSNLLTQVGQVPEYLAAATIGKGRLAAGKALGAISPSLKARNEHVLYSEVGARALGMVSGVKRGLINGSRAFRTEVPSDMISKAEQLQQRAIGGRTGKIIRLPTRALMGADEVFKGMARQSAIDGLALRHAYREGHRGQAFKQRAAELAASPTQEIMEEAFDYARYVTFQRPTGTIGTSIMRWKQDIPALALIVPFVRTPTNLLKYAVERSPIAPILKEWRADFMAGGAKRDLAVAKVMVGSGIGAAVTLWAADGKITGGGPADENATRLLRADGWQPYSVKIGDTWVAYQRLDPYATILGIASDLATKRDKMTPAQQDRTAAILVTAVLKQMESKTWISGFVDLVKAVDSPERYGQSFIDRLVGSIVVPTGLSQVARTIDPVQRDKTDVPGVPSFLDSPASRVMSRVPGLSDNLPAKVDVWGNDITGEGGAGPDILSPLWVRHAKDDPITAEVSRLGATFGKLDRKIGDVRLTDDQYNQYQRVAGQYTYADLAEAMANPQWQEISDEERLKWVDDIKADARAAAREDLSLGAAIPKGWEVIPPGWVVER